ncbi:MAG: hypothetical protein JW754_02395 [Candidatus Aenigmarchaeota archaeon]|nr:hypothetical protein [Candidatus Aenigmarchaeota archaeon]
MKHIYNPQGGILDFIGVWKGFLSGSLALMSFMMGIIAESEAVIAVYLALFVFALFVLINSLMRNGGVEVYFFQTWFSFAFGAVVSVAMFLGGLGNPWMAIVLLLVIVTYVLRYGSLVIKKIR